MLKFLLVLFVIWVLARLAKRWLLAQALRMQQGMAEQLHAQMRSQMGAGMDSAAAAAASTAQTQASDARAGSGVERMVACARCGLHIPQSEVVQAGGSVFCSVEHAHAV
jgi:hypothetical protein